MRDYPRQYEYIIPALVATLTFTLLFIIKDEVSIVAITAIAIILTVIAIYNFADNVTFKIIQRRAEREWAKTYYAGELAKSIKGLTNSQIRLLESYSTIRILGIYGDIGVIWLVRCPGGLDVPLAFVDDFLNHSQLTDPYLFPIRRAKEIGEGNGWSNAVQYAGAVTKLLINAGHAEQAAGTHAAVIKTPLPDIAELFGVTLEGRVP